MNPLINLEKYIIFQKFILSLNIKLFKFLFLTLINLIVQYILIYLTLTYRSNYDLIIEKLKFKLYHCHIRK